MVDNRMVDERINNRQMVDQRMEDRKREGDEVVGKQLENGNLAYNQWIDGRHPFDRQMNNQRNMEGRVNRVGQPVTQNTLHINPFIANKTRHVEPFLLRNVPRNSRSVESISKKKEKDEEKELKKEIEEKLEIRSRFPARRWRGKIYDAKPKLGGGEGGGDQGGLYDLLAIGPQFLLWKYVCVKYE